MSWSKINIADYKKGQKAEINEVHEVSKCGWLDSLRNHLGRTEAKDIWKEKFHFGQKFEVST